MSSWNSTQHRAFTSVTEKRKNILLIGPGGVGKSEVIKHVIKYFKNEKKKLGITSINKNAGLKIGGTGLLQFMHLTNERLKLNYNELLDDLRKRNNIIQLYKNLDCLIIDEIESLSTDIFELIDKLLREFRNEDAPFGKTQIFLVGDFYKCTKPKYIFQSLSFWDAIDEVHELRYSYRQTDLSFINLLHRMRRNEINDEDIYEINNCVRKEKESLILPTKYTNDENVIELNQKKLDEINEESVEMETYAGKKGKRCAESDEFAQEVTTIQNLKIGAQVILTHNLNEEHNLIAGARGVVVGFTEKNDKKSTNFHELEGQFIVPEDIKLPIVQFLNGKKLKIPYVCDKNENDTYCWHICLMLGWYVNEYTSNGLTIDCLQVNLNNIQHPMNAMNKIKNLDSLLLEEKVSKDIFTVDKRILQFYDFPFHLQKNLSTDDMQLASENEILQSLEKIKWQGI